MQFYDLPQGSTLIASAYLHPLIQNEIINHQNGLFDIHFKTFSNLFLHPRYSQIQLLWEFYHTIQTLPPFPILKHHVTSYPFLKEVHQMLFEMEQYSLSFENLPTSTPIQVELRQILMHLHQLFPTLIETKSFEPTHLYLFDDYHNHYESQKINELCHKGAVLCTPTPKTPDIHFYHAINKRQEVASVADIILTKQYRGEEVQITVCDPSYKPFIEQIFSYHKIPFTILFDSHASAIVISFIQLLEYYMCPDRNHLSVLLDSAIFDIPYLPALNTYLQLFETDLDDEMHHVQNASISNDILSHYEMKELQELEIKASTAKEALLPLLAPFQQNIQDVIIYCFSLLSNHKQTATLQKLSDLISESMPYLQKKEDITFFIELCQDISEQQHCDTYQGVLVTDLKKPLLPCGVQFILGCDQKHYPAFQSKQGFFDESYCEWIGYPSLHERYQETLTQLKKHHAYCDTLYLFYAQGDFQGKNNEAALEIELLANGKSTLYPLPQHDAQENTIASISKQCATSLFVSQGEIKGSISAFERYVACPFSYFLRYGLGVKDPMDVSFNVSKIGTLSHYVMEQLCRTYQKQYTQHHDEVYPIMKEKIQEMMQVYPNQTALLENILQRLYHNMEVLFDYLKQMEEASSFAPAHLEYVFQERIPTKQDITIVLNGIIDRIDFYSHFLRIIDYKSSSKVLSLTDILCGKQLQLLTYAYIAKKQFQKDVAEMCIRDRPCIFTCLINEILHILFMCFFT